MPHNPVAYFYDHILYKSGDVSIAHTIVSTKLVQLVPARGGDRGSGGNGNLEGLVRVREVQKSRTLVVLGERGEGAEFLGMMVQGQVTPGLADYPVRS